MHVKANSGPIEAPDFPLVSRAVSRPDREPTDRELRAIEAEWPRIAAELAVLDAEIAALTTGEPSSELSRRRVRRAKAQLTRQITADTQRPGSLDGVA